MALRQRGNGAKTGGNGKLKKSHADWYRRAEELLSVPRPIVDTLVNYTDDANSLYAWRYAIADLLAR